MDEREQMPMTEDSPVITVTVRAEGAPAEGARVSVDYVTGRARVIDVTWLVADPEGAWIVSAVTPAGEDDEGRALVNLWLDNPSRPDLPS